MVDAVAPARDACAHMSRRLRIPALIVLAAAAAWFASTSSCATARPAPAGEYPVPPYVVPRAAWSVDAGTLLHFAVIGDYGDGSGDEDAVARLVHGWQPDFIITTGDNNYPLGMQLTLDDHVGKYYSRYIGDYHGAYGKGAETNRFWPAPGNHDWYAPDGLNPYINYFRLPGNERYYDVDLGLVHLFALDTDDNEPDGVSVNSKQAHWLQRVLTASRACFKVVYLHHAPFSSSRHGSNRTMQWPFKEWGADVVLAGHDHVYERLDVDGMTYIVNGIGGASIYGWSTVLPQSRARYNETHGAQRVTVTARAMTLEFRNVQDKVIDTFTVERECFAGPTVAAVGEPLDAGPLTDH